MRSVLVAAIVASAAWIAALAVGVGPVWAHANLVRSDPASSAAVEDAHEVTLWFSEPPEPAFSEITVFDSLGRRVSDGHLDYDPREPLTLLTALPELADGSYTVAWKTLSAVDGHVTRGAFTFAIGIGQRVGQPVVPGLAPTGDAPVVPPIEIVVRWWTYLAVAVLVGGVVFGWFVAGPATGWSPRVEGGLRRSVLAAGLAALLAGFAALVLQAATIADVSLAEALGSPIWTLLTTRYGLVWLVRTAATLVLTATLFLAWSSERRRWLGPLQVTLAGVILLAMSLNSHAAAVQTDAAMAIAMDWVHLLGTAIWIGGLCQLAVVVPVVLRTSGTSRRPVFGAMVGRFSPLAMWCVAGLLVSGLYQGLIATGSLEALVVTPWGRSLLAKLVLVAVMLVLGLVNARWMRRRLVATDSPADDAGAARLLRRFGLVVGTEALLGFLILGTVGVLTSLETGRDAVLRAPTSFRAEQRADDLRIQIGVTPAVAGQNSVDVRLSQGWLARPAEAQRVSLRFEHLEHDMGENEAVAEARGDGRWTASANGLAMVGRWQVGVLVRRDGRDDTRANFEVPLADPSEQPARPGIAVIPRISRLIVGLALIALAVVLLARVPAVRWPRLARAAAIAPMLGGIVVLWAGISMESAAPTTALSNPISATEASLQRGREIFAANCAACHGPSGRGDGPLAASLQPPPANLQQHAREHPETYLFGRISRGSPGTAMPAFGGVLSEEERWHTVNFIVQILGAEE